MRFGEITIYKHQKNVDLIFTKSYNFSSLNSANEKLEKLKQRQSHNHPYSLKLLGFSTSTLKGLCATSYEIKCFYEYPKTDMNK